MEKIEIIEVDGIKHVIIDHGNNEFTSMPKSVYDEMQAKQNEGKLNAN